MIKKIINKELDILTNYLEIIYLNIDRPEAYMGFVKKDLFKNKLTIENQKILKSLETKSDDIKRIEKI